MVSKFTHIRYFFVACFIVLYIGAKSQDSLLHRKWITLGAYTMVGSGTLIGLNELWYKDYPRSGFHLFNDNSEWLQMDKAGHIMTTYAVNSILYPSFLWAGYNRKQSLLLSGGISFGYQMGIEFLDAYSTEWGFSFGDALSNFLGSSIFLAQELFWNEQRIRLKYSYHKSEYADLRPGLLGVSNSQRLLKDYNAQTYWMSLNVHSFLHSNSKFPKWLNVAFGYGADGMTGAKTSEINGYSYDRFRQYYFSLDVDLTKINWPKQWMKSVASILNVIKLPCPTVEFAVNRNINFFIIR